MFAQQFHYGIFYAYLKLREQEVRNLMWLSECIAQDQKYRIVDGVISIFWKYDDVDFFVCLYMMGGTYFECLQILPL